MSNRAKTISLRPSTPEDEAFLYEVYKSTRAEEMAAWGWPTAQQDAFLQLQFKAQQMSYQMEDGQSGTQIILLDGQPVGQLIVNRTESEIHLTDISLLTEHRSGGIGTLLIKELFEEAAAEGKVVELHVLKTNRAMRLYERLGFKTIGESGMHFQMQWVPGTERPA
ncbi:MAG: N-acetyltransferase [Pyrinomonadaceae bacterium]|nr:N-acetyltransferase [Pyrinomonadaceae bacterium]